MNKYAAVLINGDIGSDEFLGIYDAQTKIKAKEKADEDWELSTSEREADSLKIIRVFSNSDRAMDIGTYGIDKLHDCQSNLEFVKYRHNAEDVEAIMECSICGDIYRDIYEYSRREEIDNI